MKYVTSIEGMKVEIYIEDYNTSDIVDVTTVIAIPEGRWVNHSASSMEFIKHDAFPGHIAQQVLNSYNERNA